MKYSNKSPGCLILLALITLTGCGTTTPEGSSSAITGANPASPLPAVSLSERLSSAISSTGSETADTVKVTSIDGIVLLTGQVLSEEAKSRVTNAAAFSGGSELRRLTNELQVVDTIDTSGAEQNILLATAVESLLNSTLPELAQYLKIVAENGRVFMLGRISHEQADTAIDLVRRLKGVDTISTVFVYTD